MNYIKPIINKSLKEVPRSLKLNSVHLVQKSPIDAKYYGAKLDISTARQLATQILLACEVTKENGEIGIFIDKENQTIHIQNEDESYYVE